MTLQLSLKKAMLAVVALMLVAVVYLVLQPDVEKGVDYEAVVDSIDNGLGRTQLVDISSIAELEEAFDADKGTPRLVLLVGPY